MGAGCSSTRAGGGETTIAKSHQEPEHIVNAGSTGAATTSNSTENKPPAEEQTSEDNETAKRREELSDQRDGRSFPVILSAGSLRIFGGTGVVNRDVSLAIRFPAGDRLLHPSDDTAIDQEVKFQVVGGKQKLVSFFQDETDDDAAISSSILSNEAASNSLVVCNFEQRFLQEDTLPLTFCLTVWDGTGSSAEFEETVNLLNEVKLDLPHDSTSTENEKKSTTVVKVEFKSLFSSKPIAALEFTFRILFNSLVDRGARLILQASRLASQHPLLYNVLLELLAASEDLVVTGKTENKVDLPPSVAATLESNFNALLKLVKRLTSESKLSFVKNHLKGKEVADEYKRLCTEIVHILEIHAEPGSIDKNKLTEMIDKSAGSIVNASSAFFDAVLAAKGGAMSVKADVTSFLERYKASTAETAAQGAEAGGSFSRLAGLLCDVNTLVAPLVRAAPFGMLVVEVVGVVFKLIVSRNDMKELCDKIASRLTLFLRVLQQPSVQALIRDDAATIDACVAVYIAIDDCGECIKQFQSRNLVIQLLTASSQLSALSNCYKDLNEQFHLLHDVTSLRSMAMVQKAEADGKTRFQEILSLQLQYLLSMDGSGHILRNLASRMDDMQRRLCDVVAEKDVLSSHGDHNSPNVLRSLVEATIKEALVDIVSNPETAMLHKNAEVDKKLQSMICAPATTLDAAARFGADAAKLNQTDALWLPLAHRRSEEDVSTVCSQFFFTFAQNALAENFATQSKKQGKSRSEARKEFKKLSQQMETIRDSQASMEGKLDQLISLNQRELLTIQDMMKDSVIGPLQRIEEHIKQCTEYKAMNKPQEIAMSDLVEGSKLSSSPTAVVHAAVYRGSRHVVTKRYTSLVDDMDRVEEAAALFQLHHRSIVELVGVVTSSTTGSIEMIVVELLGSPLAYYTSLPTLKSDNWHSLLSKEQKLTFTYDLLAALNFIHSQSPPRLHCDISTSNVLSTTDMRSAKITDFKSSQIFLGGGASTSVKRYDPTKGLDHVGETRSIHHDEISFVQVDRYRNPPGVLSDMFAAGIVLFELWTQSLSYRGRDGTLLDKAIRDGEEPFSASDLQAIPKIVRAIIVGLTDPKPARRLPMSQILRLQEQFGQHLLEAPESSWVDYFPHWNTINKNTDDESITLCTDNIPKFTRQQLRKYLNEKEIDDVVCAHIERRGYTAKQYLRNDFMFKAFPPELRPEFDELHLDSFAELQEFDSAYHSEKLLKNKTTSLGKNTSEQPQGDQKGLLPPSSSSQTSAKGHEASDAAIVETHLITDDPILHPAAESAIPFRHAILAAFDDATNEDEEGIETRHLSQPSTNSTVVVKRSLNATKFVSRVKQLIRTKQTTDLQPDHWLSLARCDEIMNTGFVVRSGDVFTRKECFRKALECSNLTSIDAWIGVAESLESSSATLTVKSIAFSRKDALTRALALDPKRVEPWIMLVSVLAENETIIFDNKEISRRGCCERALALRQDSAPLWVSFSMFLSSKESVRVAGVPKDAISKLTCITTAVSLDPTNARFWTLLSQTLQGTDTVQVNGVEINKCKALEKSIECDPSNGLSWLTLGLKLSSHNTVTVNGKSYSRKQCFCEAAGLGVSQAYDHLGYEMQRLERVFVKDEEVSKVTVYCRALEHDDSSYSPWNNLGVEMIYQKMYPPQTVKIGARDYNMTQIFVNSIERDPTFGKAWNGLGISLANDQTITVLRREYTKQECYLKSLALLPTYCFAWNWLGMTLTSTNDVITVNNEVVTKRQCFQRAIQYSWDYAYPWWNLAMDMQAEESVQLKKGQHVETFSYNDVLRRAEHFYPSDKDILERVAKLNEHKE